VVGIGLGLDWIEVGKHVAVDAVARFLPTKSFVEISFHSGSLHPRRACNYISSHHLESHYQVWFI
jgi:hypothetical protein